MVLELAREGRMVRVPRFKTATAMELNGALNQSLESAVENTICQAGIPRVIL